MQPFTINSVLTEKDAIVIGEKLFRKRNRYVFWGGRIIAYLSLFTSFFLVQLEFERKANEPSNFLETICLIIISLLLLLLPKLRAYQFRKNFMSNASVKNGLVSRFSDDKIEILAGESTSQAPWVTVYDFVQISNWHLLMFNEVNYIPISKNQITEEQVLWIESKIEKQKLLSK
ncbi:YcxB family protein [Runella sp. SP2]|uniref:YcxB family protein n=1 Tax=Runella sp. SP2 TaxID=2268026 RepID=UPI000F07EC4A|nr:YcxB family protein [Runella sp. SP2]AYQ34356.1 YcxB family protein [Runella sp. SP2]